MFALFQDILCLPTVLEKNMTNRLDEIGNNEATMVSFAEDEFDMFQGDTFRTNFDQESSCQHLIYLLQETRGPLKQL